MTSKHEDLLLVRKTLSATKGHLIHTSMFLGIMSERLESQVKFASDKIQGLLIVKKKQTDYLLEIFETSEKLSKGYKSGIKINEDIAQKLNHSLQSIEDDEKELSNLINEVRRMSDCIQVIKSMAICNDSIEDLSMGIEQIEESIKQLCKDMKENKESVIHINNDLSSSINIIKDLNETNQSISLAVDNINTFVENISNNIDDLENVKVMFSGVLSKIAQLSNENKETLEQIEKALVCDLLNG